MPDIVVYLIKANVALVLFYLGYRLLLRRLTFYNLNRFYLLFGLLFSAFYPFVNLTKWATKQEGISGEVMYILPVWEPISTQEFSIWPYVVVVFWLAVVFFAARLVIRLFSLWVVHIGSVAARWQMFHYRQVFQHVNPFSFWRNIYLNVHQHEEVALTEIFHHEQVHVEEYHTVDILITELCSVLCWFNPAAWLYRYAVRENLEFITDRRVLQNGADRKAYQYSLLRTTTNVLQPSLGANFNLRSIKRRIRMMNKKRSSKLQISKYLLAIPTIAVFVLVFTITKAYQEEHHIELTNTDGSAASDGSRVGGEFTFRGGQSLGHSDTTATLSQPRAAQLEDRVNATDTTKRGNVITLRGLDSRGDEPLFILDGVRMDKTNGVKGFSLDELDPNLIASIDVLKGQSAEAIYGEAGKNGVVLITTVHRGVNSVIPKKLIGEVNSVNFNVDSLTVSGKEGDVSAKGKSLNEVVVVGYGSINPVDSTKTKTAEVVLRGVGGDKPFQNVLIIMDGKEVSEQTLRDLNPNDIDSMTVLKDASGTDKYGKKGEKGVIEITTKSKK